MDDGRHLPLTDAQLDRELEAALGIEPSPEFLARARMRVAEQVAPSGFSRIVESGFSRMDVVSAFRRTSIDPLAAVALAGVVLAVVVPGLVREKPAVPQTAARSATPVEAAPAEPTVRTVVTSADPTGSARPGRQQPVARDAEEMHTLPLQLSPVMFAEEDRAAFAAFVTAAGDGRVPETLVEAPNEEDIPALVIEPLKIDPLPVLARVDRQGEGQW